MQNPAFRYLNVLKIFLIIIIIITSNFVAKAQVGQNDLVPLLSASDQKSIQNIEKTYNKGKQIEEEVNKLKSTGTSDKEMAKNEKKYAMKRLEASQYFQKANSQMISLLQDNISQFWKKNKNITVPSELKNKEGQAGELAKNAKASRKVSEDLIYPDEKLVKIIEAEGLEKDAIIIYVKVLYAYLNLPIGFDELKKDEKVKTSEVSKTDSAATEIKTAETQDLPLALKDSLIQQPKAELSIAAAPVDSLQKDKQVQNTPLSNKSEAPQEFKKPEPVLPSSLSAKKDTSSLYNMVSVQEEQVDKFNKSLEDSFSTNYENYVINFRDLNYRDVESLRRAWYEYLHSWPDTTGSVYVNRSKAIADTTKAIAMVDDNARNGISKQTTTRNSLPDNNQSNNEKVKPSDKHTAKTTEKSKDKSGEKKSGKPIAKNTTAKQNRDSISTSTTTARAEIDNKNAAASDASGFATNVAKGFVYRVQIGACRIPLDKKALKGVYDGELPTLELHEEGWYKYAVGEFNTYHDAKKLKEQLNVPGAFIIAYLNGKRIKILNTNMSSVEEHETTGNPSVTFKVQIAASKSKLSQKYVNNIYKGGEVEEFSEDGWYKYAVTTGPSVKAAKNFIEKENIPGAFIIAFFEGKKIELKDALKMNK